MAAATALTSVLAIGSTVISAAGQYRQGQQQAAALQAESQHLHHQAQLAEYDATRHELEASREEYEAAQRELVRRQELNRTIGTQRAMWGARGIDIASGSPKTVLDRTVELSEQEGQAIRMGGEIASTGQRMAAEGARSVAQGLYGQSRFVAGQAGPARFAGALRAGGSLLQGYMNFRDIGGPR